MIYRINENTLEPVEFLNFSDLGKVEKDLENILAENMFTKLFEDAPFLPIFQERPFKAEVDIVAIDKNGNLVIFELKKDWSDEYTIPQIFRYVQNVQKWDYEIIEQKYIQYEKSKGNNIEENFSFLEKHQEIFGIPEGDKLDKKDFNKSQKMLIVAHAADSGLCDSIDYWKKNGVNVDFIPYRIYQIEKELFFEFFSKPYDYHINPKNIKGVVFDTNCSYDQEAYKYMLENNRVSAFWDRKEAVYSLQNQDYVFLSHKGVGIIAIGKVTSSVKKGTYEGEESELYVDVDYIQKASDVNNLSPLISYSQIKELIGKTFFHARINKVPYLTSEESKTIIDSVRNGP